MPALFAIAMIASACGALENGTFHSNGWRLDEISQDGQQLFITTSTGGCQQVQEVFVEEREDLVFIDVRLPRQDECAADIPIQLGVDLEEPLGERRLTGCGLIGDSGGCLSTQATEPGENE